MLFLFLISLLPALHYDCQLWGLHTPIGEAKSAKADLQSVYDRFLRRIGGVKHAPRAILLEELTLSPLQLIWRQQTLEFWNTIAAIVSQLLVLLRTLFCSDNLHDALVILVIPPASTSALSLLIAFNTVLKQYASVHPKRMLRCLLAVFAVFVIIYAMRLCQGCVMQLLQDCITLIWLYKYTCEAVSALSNLDLLTQSQPDQLARQGPLLLLVFFGCCDLLRACGQTLGCSPTLLVVLLSRGDIVTWWTNLGTTLQLSCQSTK